MKFNILFIFWEYLKFRIRIVLYSSIYLVGYILGLKFGEMGRMWKKNKVIIGFL